MNDSYPESWTTYAFRAMGSEITLWLETMDLATADIAFSQAQALFEDNEQALSRFRADSELSRVNAHSEQWVPVSDLLWDVLTTAVQMAEISNGYFDPTMLNALERSGYTSSFEQLGQSRQNGQLSQFSHRSGRWIEIEFDDGGQSVFLPARVRVDLGGIAKGYTAQQAADLLGAFGPCLVNAGGDLVAGEAPKGYPGWPVAISAPSSSVTETPIDLCNLWLAQEAMATSGIDFRTWQRGERMMHHLMDPATGAPAATDGVTVTVLAEDAALAEGWATAALVAGVEEGLAALLEARLPGLMVSETGDILINSAMQQRLQLLPI